MKLTGKPRAGACLGAAAALCAAATIAAPTSANAATGHDAQGCVTYTNLIEKAYYAKQLTGTPGVPAPGASGIYRDHVYDAAGNVIGGTDGYSAELYVDPADGHLMAYYLENVTLPEGTFVDGGLVDYTDLARGAWVSFHAVGTGGALLGATGTRSWHIIGLTSGLTVGVDMDLHGPSCAPRG